MTWLIELNGRQTESKDTKLDLNFRFPVEFALQAKRLMGKVMQVASFSLAEVTYITGDIGYQVQESVKNAQFRVRAKQENVSGVMLPVFESYQEGANGNIFFYPPSACRECWQLPTERRHDSRSDLPCFFCFSVDFQPLLSQRAHGSRSRRTAGSKVQGDIHQSCRDFG